MSYEQVKTISRNTGKTGFNLPDDVTIFLTSQAILMTGWEETKPSYEENYFFDQPVGTASEYGAGFTFPGLFKLKQQGRILISETGVDSGYVGSRLGKGNREGLYGFEFPHLEENNGIANTANWEFLEIWVVVQ